MLTYLVEFTSGQLSAVRLAMDERTEGLIEGIRESMQSAYLSAADMQQQVDIDLKLLMPTLAALQNVDPVKADARLTELGALMVEYRELLSGRLRDEAEVDAWNARVEAERKAAAAATATARA